MYGCAGPSTRGSRTPQPGQTTAVSLPVISVVARGATFTCAPACESVAFADRPPGGQHGNRGGGEWGTRPGQAIRPWPAYEPAARVRPPESAWAGVRLAIARRRVRADSVRAHPNEESSVPYIEGFVAAVPTANKDEYVKHAREAVKYFKDLVVLR